MANGINIQWCDHVQDLFLTSVARCGQFHASCREANVNHQTVKNHLKSDPEFAKAYELAQELHNEKAEAVLRLLGLEGEEEDVWYKGEKVGSKTPKIVMRALEMYIKRRMPEYRETGVAVDVKSGGVLVVNAPAEDAKSWAEKHNKKVDTPDEG